MIIYFIFDNVFCCPCAIYTLIDKLNEYLKYKNNDSLGILATILYQRFCSNDYIATIL